MKNSLKTYRVDEIAKLKLTNQDEYIYIAAKYTQADKVKVAIGKYC